MMGMGMGVGFSSPPPWTPAALASKQVLWLRSRDVVLAGSDIAQANDNSGKAHHAVSTGAPPSIVANYVNGHPAVYHDGTPEYLSIASHADFNLTGDMTLYFVTRPAVITAYRQVILTRTNGGSPAPWDSYNTGAVDMLWGIRSTNVGIVTPTAGAWHRIGIRCSGAVGNGYLDGAWGANVALGAAHAVANVPVLVGTRDDLFTKNNGHWTEIFAFNAALTDAEMLALDTWAKAEYGI